MNPFAVDQTYVASVRALYEILAEISDRGQGRWNISDRSEHHVVLAFSPDSEPEINIVKFRFPIIGYLPFPNLEGVIVALYPPIRQDVEYGLHMQRGNIVHDPVADWDAFWLPIAEELKKRHSTGMCSGTSTTDSSSSSESRNRT
jgi:hypothetical protein